MNRASSERVAVCFVCLGNICRSPTAEGVFNRQLRVAGLDAFVHVESAGTAAYHQGEPADRRSRQFARSRGIDITSVARQFVVGDFNEFDYVLAMDADNLVCLQKLKLKQGRIAAPSKEKKLHLGLLRDFDRGSPQGSSVPDPYYGGDLGFEEVLNQCERACRGLIEHLQRHHFPPHRL